jgi:hypothetical protein
LLLRVLGARCTTRGIAACDGDNGLLLSPSFPGKETLRSMQCPWKTLSLIDLIWRWSVAHVHLAPVINM